MKLYYVPRTRATRPRWMLEELGIPCELVRLDPSKGETRTPEHLARHPLGHVPVLEADDGTMLFESGAICLWLAERHPEKGLVPPPGTPERARVYQWLFFAATELEPPLGELHRLQREGSRDEAAIAAARGRFLAAAGAVDAALARTPNLAGERFGVADLMVAACLAWGKAMLGGRLDDLPNADAWLLHVKARPAFRRAYAD